MTRKMLPLTVVVFTGALGFSAAPVWSGFERAQYQDQHSSQIQTKGKNGSKTARSEMTPGYVKEAQQALKERGYQPGPIDGVFGRRTRAALRSFQHYSQLSRLGSWIRKRSCCSS